MNEILTTILKNTYSLNQLKHRLRILKANLLKTFFGGNPDSIPDVNLPAQDQNWLKSLPESLYREFNKDNVYQIFDSIELEISKLKTLTMYLAFEPDELTLSQIGEYSRKNFSSTLLLDIKLDPNLFAGAALVWKGIYKDYSLRAKIEEKKVEISEGFKRFLR